MRLLLVGDSTPVESDYWTRHVPPCMAAVAGLGTCESCGAHLDVAGGIHFDPSAGLLLCRSCCPFCDQESTT